MPVKGWHYRKGDYGVVGYEELTVAGSSVSLAGPGVAFDFAWVEVEGAALRVRLDGVAPTTTVGHNFFPGVNDLLTANEVRQLKAIATSGSGILRATYYVY